MTTLTPQSLSMFTGTEGYTRWSPLFRHTVLTDGAKFVAENGGVSGAYWLMDLIASYQPDLRKKYPWARDMQFWKLTVDLKTKTAVATCRQDSNLPPVVTQNIEYTDFDLPEIELWVGPLDENTMTIFLPSEY